MRESDRSAVPSPRPPGRRESIGRNAHHRPVERPARFRRRLRPPRKLKPRSHRRRSQSTRQGGKKPTGKSCESRAYTLVTPIGLSDRESINYRKRMGGRRSMCSNCMGADSSPQHFVSTCTLAAPMYQLPCRVRSRPSRPAVVPTRGRAHRAAAVAWRQSAAHHECRAPARVGPTVARRAAQQKTRSQATLSRWLHRAPAAPQDSAYAERPQQTRGLARQPRAADP